MRLFTLAILALVFTQHSYAREGREEIKQAQPSEQTQTVADASPEDKKTQPKIVNKHDILNTFFLDRRPYQKVNKL